MIKNIFDDYIFEAVTVKYHVCHRAWSTGAVFSVKCETVKIKAESLCSCRMQHEKQFEYSRWIHKHSMPGGNGWVRCRDARGAMLEVIMSCDQGLLSGSTVEKLIKIKIMLKLLSDSNLALYGLLSIFNKRHCSWLYCMSSREQRVGLVRWSHHNSEQLPVKSPRYRLAQSVVISPTSQVTHLESDLLIRFPTVRTARMFDARENARKFASVV